MLSIAIIDDEEVVLKKLKSYIDKYFNEDTCEVAGEYVVDCYSDGMSFLSAQCNSYEIVFMDIKMPMKDGIAVAREFRKSNELACLLFVTNLADMAIKGYEVNALDFIVKPIGYGDFKYRMDKAVRKARAIEKNSSIVLRINKSSIKIPIQSIIYVETIRHKVVYHTLTGEIEEWGTMRDAEKRLRRYHFSRCNSGYLVNLRYVDTVSGVIVRMGKTEIPISRTRRVDFMADMMNYVGVGSVAFDD